MKKTNPLPAQLGIAVFLSFCTLAPAAAQTATPPPATPAPEDTIVLSPFEVRTDKDQGYVATSSLAGSRFNTSLNDIASPISVMTKEFLNDIGFVDVNQALEYGVNTLDEIDSTGNGRVGANAVTFKVRGIAGGGRARNYFGTGQNVDFYNTERLDFSRGPNSVLFGLGSPAGIINSSTKFARIGRDIREVTARIGSYDDYRVTLDVNEGISKKLAFRANLLWEDTKGYREFEFEKKKGLALAGTWRPFGKTQVKFEAEKIDRDQNRARPWAPVDLYSVWRTAGSLGAGSATTWGNAVAGTGGTTNMLVLNSGPLAGQVFWNTTAQGFRTSNGPNTITGLNTPPNVVDFSLLPRNANFAGPGPRIDQDTTVGSIYLEQQIGENLNIEIAGSTEYQKSTQIGYVNFAQIGVRYDANAFLPQYNSAGAYTGTVPNPNFGKMFLSALGSTGNNSHIFRKSYRAEARVTVGYNLDFTKVLSGSARLGQLLGHHRLGYLHTQQGSDGDSRTQRRVNVSPLRAGGPTSNYFIAQNHVVVGSYIDPFSGNVAERGFLDPDRFEIPNQAIRGNNAFAIQSELRNVAWNWSEAKQQAHMVATQSYFWRDRIVALFGWRRDTSKSFGSTQVAHPITGEVSGYLRNATPNGVTVLSPDGKTKGDTFTRGVVFHAWPGLLSLYYNQATNFQGNATGEVFGERNNLQSIGNREGRGEDGGLKLDLFRGRVSARVGVFQTEDSNQGVAYNGVYPTYINGILDAVFTASGAPGAPKVVGGTTDLAQRDIRDFSSKGIEVEVTANPIRQLRLTANLSRTQAVNKNLFPYVRAYVAANRAAWALRSSAPINQPAFPGTAATVGGVLAQIDAQIQADLASDGQRPIRDRELTGNAFANYTFANEGFLKGWGVGAGLQYRGPSLLGYRVFTDGQPAFTPALTSLNALVTYRKRLTTKLHLRLQLNIQNLLNDLEPQAVSGGQPANLATNTLPLLDGVAYNIQLPEPRRYSVSATFEF
jgi:iron complex outermembrane receptor protein